MLDLPRNGAVRGRVVLAVPVVIALALTLVWSLGLARLFSARRTELLTRQLIACIQARNSPLALEALNKGALATNEALRAAILADEPEIARKLVETGAPLDPIESGRQSPLMHAAAAGKADMITYLIERGADVHRLDMMGQNARFLAASQGHQHAYRALVAHGATPTLYTASAIGDMSAVRKLLASGEIPDSPAPNGMTPLLVAVLRGHARIVSMLLEAGADPNRPSEDGAIPLRLARGLQNPVLERMLLKHGARDRLPGIRPRPRKAAPDLSL